MFIISCSLPGSIQYAECSQSTDAQNIMSEIGRRALNDVDFAIHVLLTAEMVHTSTQKNSSSRCGYWTCSIFRNYSSSHHVGSVRCFNLLSHGLRPFLYQKQVDQWRTPSSGDFLQTSSPSSPLEERGRRSILSLEGIDQGCWFFVDHVVSCVLHCHPEGHFTSLFLAAAVQRGHGFRSAVGLSGHWGHCKDSLRTTDFADFLCSRHKSLCILQDCWTCPLAELLPEPVNHSLCLCAAKVNVGPLITCCEVCVFQRTFFVIPCQRGFRHSVLFFFSCKVTMTFSLSFGHGGREDTSSGASDDPMDATQDEGSSDGELVQSSAVSC